MYEKTRAQGFGAEVKRRVILGTYVLSSGFHDAYYLRAQKVRTLIRRDFERAFGSATPSSGPVTPTAAFRVGEKSADPAADVPRRHFHGEREPGGDLRPERAVRIHGGGPAGGPARRGAGLRGCARPGDRRGLPARDGLAPETAGRRPA
jgi:hypothetical protein